MSDQSTTWANDPHTVQHDGRTQTVYPCGCKTAGYGDHSSPARIIFCGTHSKAFNLRDALRNVINSATLLTKRAKDANAAAAVLLTSLEVVPK